MTARWAVKDEIRVAAVRLAAGAAATDANTTHNDMQ